MDENTIATTVATAFTTALITKGAKGPAKTFGLLWQATFGRWDNQLQAYIDRRNKNFKEYAENIAEEVDQIPDNELKEEPNTSIIGPALEASKYYIEEEIPRKMFAKLIASSMDKRKDGLVHQSFVEIIKQMSPDDAKVLIELTNPSVLINCLVKRTDLENQNEWFSDIFLSPNIPEEISVNSVSISNLERLGLLYIPNRNLGNLRMNSEDKTTIEQFKNTTLYKALMHDCENPASPRKSVEIITYLAYLTKLAFAFKSVCL